MAVIPVILDILKIIGLVLAVAVGYVLLLVLLVMFVPIRYKVKVLRTGIEGDDQVDVKGHVSWLLHILHVSLGYPGEHIAIIRVFGIPVAKLPLTEEEKAVKEEKKRRKEEKKEEKERRKNGKHEQSAQEDQVDEESSEDDDNHDPGHELAEDNGFFSHEGLDDADKMEESEDTDEADDGITDETSESGPDETKDNEESSKKSIFSRISDFINNIRYKISNIGYTIKSNYDKISDNVHYYHKVLTSELFERTYEKCKARLIRLLKEIIPKKRELDLEVGFEDPYTTGEILAIAGIMYPIFGEHVHITGNFEEEIIRGKGYFKGRLFVFSLVKLAVFYFTSKDLKRLISLFKKEPPNKRNKGHKGKGRRSNGGDQ